ncbi:MAG TPA: hemin uptake protein HemP [Hyphomicrobiaceae bacterium]|nr:hemin uptake protein HemP [Hyphomicrobiaceae bacterium]
MSSKEGARTGHGEAAGEPGSPSPRLRRWRVVELLGDAKEAILEHEGQDYRLRITSNRKLILTK